MWRIICFITTLLLLISCKPKKEAEKIKVVDKVPDSFQMYKASEMAALMRTMLAENKKLRTQIIQGENIGAFNKIYLKIHTATLTDSTDLDATYPAFANHFIKKQKEVFEVAKNKQKEQFNAMVNACVVCHQNRCAGPIPRINKLKID